MTITLKNYTFCPQIVSIEGPETSTCIKLPLGSHYSAKIRAKPTGNIYSGDWSDWSDVVTGDTPPNKSVYTKNNGVHDRKLRNSIYI